ncbi:MAG: UDP-glucose 4-epimerase [Ktedonobacterales bacterium]|jgi:UDP-glucose 4-epimerase|nr:MAG: UDP-glucose 4-epimerase [Ktedonobacterales bacterium]
MQVLVTGGAGYIGSVIVEELVRAGHTPVVYDALAKGHLKALAPEIPFVRGEVADADRLRTALLEYQIEAVIHMAGLIEVGLSVTNPDRFFETNVGGTISVLRAMIDVGVRKLVFSSTAALYGDPEQLPIAEDAPTQPTNPYGQSKLMAEQMMRWVAPAHGLTCTALRYFNAAGATERNGEMHDPETHLIPLVLKAAAEKRAIPIFGTDYPTADGTTVRDYVHVVDLAQAHLRALSREEPGLRIYNVGNGNGYSVRQVIEAAREVTGAELPIEEQPRRAGDQVATVASSERIRRELGWEPQHADLRDILGSAWRWMQSHPKGYEEA